jgi:hypothetical protein
MPGAIVAVVSGHSLTLTAQVFTQDTISYVYWYKNGSLYSSAGASSLGNNAYSSSVNLGTTYSNGDVWTVQVQTTASLYYSGTINPVANSMSSTIAVLNPPVIATQPANQTAASSSNATFTVTASGTAPLAYQWFYASAGATNLIGGATNATCSLIGVWANNAGSYSVVVTNVYGSVTSSVATLTVNKSTPVVSLWPTASSLTYGQALSSSTLSGGDATVGGAFGFTSGSTVPPVGTNLASVTFTPTDTTNYNSVSGLISVVVVKAAPVVTAWPAASGITYGQPLSASTLSGGSVSTGGSFAFASPTTMPGAGTYYASVIFTPASSADYNSVTGTVSVAVAKATSTVTWPSATGIAYGQSLAASVLANGIASPAGAFAFASPSTRPSAGPYAASVIFTPSDSTDYGTSNGTVSVTVSKATPIVSTWPSASDIVYGQPLSASVLTNGSASTGGAFTFDSPTNILDAGTNSVSVTFTPEDSADYNSTNALVSVVVAPSPQFLTIQLQMTNAMIPLNQFTNPIPITATANSGLPVTLSLTVDSAAYLTNNLLESIQQAGTVTIIATQPGNTNYQAAVPATNTFDVTLNNQTISFDTIANQIATNAPAPLTATASSSLPVTFTVLSGPATLDTNGGSLDLTGAGTVFVEASQTGDGTNYNPAAPVIQSFQVSLAGSPITWVSTLVKTYGDPLFTLEPVSNSVSVDSYTSWNTNVAIVAGRDVTIVGSGTAVIAASDEGDNLYAAGAVELTLTVNPATPTITGLAASAITFGDTLADSTLSGAATFRDNTMPGSIGSTLPNSTLGGTFAVGANTVPGSFAFVALLTTAPSAGTNNESVIFTPDDTTNYNSVVSTVSLVVAQATPTITDLPLTLPIIFDQSLAASALIDGSASVSGSFAFADTNATPANAGTYSASIVFTPDNPNYAVVTTTVNVEVNHATPVISWPVATLINYGNPLSASALNGGSASTAGGFAFADPNTLLNVGTNFAVVVFTPNDSTDYASALGSVAVPVAQGLVEITLLPTASAITYGQSLASSVLSGGDATVGGSFAFANPSIIPADAGSFNATVLYTPTNSSYSVMTTNVMVTVNKATATVALAGTNQNYDGTARTVTATTTPEGLTVNITYNSSSTAPIAAGSYTVVGIVTDSNYTGSATGTLLIAKLPLTVVANDVMRRYGETNPVFTVVGNGFATGEGLANLSGTLSFTFEDTNASVVTVDTNTPAGIYTIIPGSLTSSDYTINFTSGTLTVVPAILGVTAGSKTNVYGSPMPALTFVYQGFVNGENSNVLSGSPALSTVATSASTVAGSPYVIVITNGSLIATNYAFHFTNGSFTVLPAPLAVTASNATSPYGATLPALTGTFVGVTNNDNLTATFVTSATSASPAGTYNITPVISDPAGALPNYTVTTNIGTLTVNTVVLTVTADNQTRLYGQTNPVLTESYSGFVNGDTPSSLTVAPTATAGADPSSWPGTYSIVPAGGVSPNYTFTYSNGTLTVTKAPLTVLGNSTNRAYGQNNPAFTATITGAVPADDLSAGFSTSATSTSPPGTYTIALSVNDPYDRLGAYNVTLRSGLLTVTPAVLTGQAQSMSREYGQTNSPFSVAYSGFENYENANVLAGSLTFACVDNNGIPTGPFTTPGAYPIHVVSGQSNSNYSVHYTDGTLTVTPAPLLVAGNGATRVYGATNPPFSATITGFVNNEDSNVLGGALVVSTPATPASPVGSYAVVPGGLTSTNYAITFTNGTLLVTPAALSVTVQSQTRVYARPNPTLTGSIAGLLNGDDITLSLTTSALASSPVGTYLIQVALIDIGGALGNYLVSTNPASLTVTKASLLVSADNLARAYGATNPPLTASYSGFVNNDTTNAVSGQPVLSTTAVTNSIVGEYPITIASGTLSAVNYMFTLSDSQLAVTQAVLTVTAANRQREYGTTNPVLTFAYSGFVNGEDTNVISGSPEISTTADINSLVGTYAIVVTNGTLEATNYSFEFVNGTLSVGQALLTVVADNQTRVYGALNPTLTVHYVGFMDGDNSGVLSGSPSVTTAATTNSVVGAYSIVVGQGTLASINKYAFTFTNGTLTVTQAPMTVIVDNQSRVYGATNPTLTGSIVGMAAGDNFGLTFATTATPASVVGQYDITPSISDPSERLSNYLVTTNAGTLTVTPAALVVTASNLSSVYGSSIPTLSGALTGIVNEDNIIPSFTTVATSASAAGTYAITPILSDPDNKLPDYTVTTNDGTLTVASAPLLVEADNQTRSYGQTNPSFTFSYVGFVNGDTSASLTALPSATTTAKNGSPLGTYPIIPSGGSSSNYSLSYSRGVLTVTKEQLTVTGNNASRAYGAPDPQFTATVTGLIPGDDITPIFSPDADITSAPGVYDIEIDLNDPLGRLGLYNVTLISGILTVTNAALTGTVASASRSYGQTNPVFTVRYTGFANGDTSNILSGTTTYSCLDSNNVPVGTNTTVGSYPIHVVSVQSAPNYTVHYVDGTLAVTPAVLLVSPENLSRLYGTTNPTLTASYSGFVDDDGTNVLSGQPELTTSADISSPVGTYDITSSLGTLSATNYTFTFTNGTLTVGKTLLAVVADNQSRTYGATNPPLTFHYSGFVDGDDTNVLSGAPALTTAADTNSPPGTYDIAASVGSLVTTNYAFGFTNGTLTVTKATLTATADSQSRTYGSANPTLTITYDGFVNGQNAGVIQSLPTANAAATIQSPVGAYQITVTGGNDTNYAFTLVDGTLQITQAPLVASADSQSRAYGSPNPVLSISYSGFVNGQDASVLESPPTASTTAGISSPVGQYNITLNGGGDTNYDITLTNGILTITQVVLTVTADHQTRPYGAANPALTFSYSGFVNGENAGALTQTPTASTTATPASPAGSYPITLSGGNDPNYNIVLVNNSLDVTTVTLTITANGATRPFGTANPPFTGTITGLRDNDPISATYSSQAQSNSPAGIYQIIPTLVDPQGLATNYNVVLVDATLNVTAALTLSPEPGFYVVGDDAVMVDTNAAVNDGGSLNFAGGTLTVTITTNAGAGDELDIESQGSGTAQIGVQGGAITYGGVAIATLAAETNSLTVSLGSNNITSTMLTALLRQVTFATDDTNAALREIQVVLNYGTNSVSASRALVLDRPPVAYEFTILAARGITVSIPYSLILSNATDLDGNPITVAGFSLVSANGGRISSSGSSLIYQPPTNFTGDSDLVAYVLSDGHGGETVGIVTLDFIKQNLIQINGSNLKSSGAQLTMGGTPGGVYLVQASTDLVNWTTIETVTASPMGIISVLDNEVANYPYRFYRAVAR